MCKRCAYVPFPATIDGAIHKIGKIQSKLFSYQNFKPFKEINSLKAKIWKISTIANTYVCGGPYLGALSCNKSFITLDCNDYKERFLPYTISLFVFMVIFSRDTRFDFRVVDYHKKSWQYFSCHMAARKWNLKS